MDRIITLFHGDDLKNTLTVIVPVHSMAGRLDCLLDWLTEIKRHALQTKVIIVEDGMDSETLDELEEFKEFSFVQVFTGVFGSPGEARNYGLKWVETEWVAFWDSDDTPYPMKIQKELQSICSEKQVLIGAFQTFDVNTKQIGNKNISKNLKAMAINPGLWRFVFRFNRIGKTRFTNHKMGEDQVFLSELNLSEHECEFSESIFYVYQIGIHGQLTQSKSSIKEIRSSILELIDVIKRQKNRVANYSIVMLFRMIFTGIRTTSLTPIEAVIVLTRNFWFFPKLWIRLFSTSVFALANTITKRGL